MSAEDARRYTEMVAVVRHRGWSLRNISAPVFDDHGDVVLMLTLIGLPKELKLIDIERHRDRLLAATDHVTHALGGRRPNAIYD